MTKIQITVNSALAPQSGRISRATWKKAEEKTLETALWPKGKFVAVDAESENGSKFQIRILESGCRDDVLEVSEDVKKIFYSDRDSIEI